MKKTDIIKPQAMTTPIAANGVKDVIPAAATGTNYCSVAEGFPIITMKDILTEGGIPPRGQGTNGLFYISTDQKVFLQNGGIITFDADVSALIGGYPQGAILDYEADGILYKVISLIDDNTYNFVSDRSNIDGAKWKYIDVGLGIRQSMFCGGILEAPNGVVTYTSTSITVKAGLKFACPNGRNADGTAKNAIFTLANDLTRTTELFSLNNIHYLQSTDVGNTWSLGGRAHSQWYVQTATPAMDKGDATNATWFNPDTNLAKTTSDGGLTWTEFLICPLVWTTNDITQPNHPITSVKALNTVKLLSLYDTIITQLDKIDTTKHTTIAYNTNYYCEDDGYILIVTQLAASEGSSIQVCGNLNGSLVYVSGVYGIGYGGGCIDNSNLIKVSMGDLFKLFTTVATGDGTVLSSLCYFYPVKREWL